MRRIARVVLVTFGSLMGLFFLMYFFDPRGEDWTYYSIRAVAFIALVILFVAGGGNLKGLFAVTPQRLEFTDSSESTDPLMSLDFRARRAFQIEECESEGSHYMIELADGSVLYLNGQYLDEYEPAGDGDDSQPRRFPCTEFTVVRNKQNGEVVDLVCRGEAIEPECMAPPFDATDDTSLLIPNDGEIFTDRGYDEIKREWMKTRGTRRSRLGTP